MKQIEKLKKQLGSRQIDRHELVPASWRHPPRQHPGRGRGAGGQQYFDAGAAFQQALDDRLEADRFAHADSVKPEQRAVRARHDVALGIDAEVAPAPVGNVVKEHGIVVGPAGHRRLRKSA